MYTTIEKAAKLLLISKYATCLTGAGISVESGIRPFRGPDGIWTEHGEPPMDSYQQFLANPKAHWENAIKNVNSDNDFLQAADTALPNLAHFALAELEQIGVIKFLITQNIDNLHAAAGSTKVAEIHGNIDKLRCIKCNSRYNRDEIKLDILPPKCPKCGGIIKTDIVLFGEPIPADTMRICDQEARKSDCMLVVGTSAMVYPAAELPLVVKHKLGVVIEIDPCETELTPYCDVIIRGTAGEVLPELAAQIKHLQAQNQK